MRRELPSGTVTFLFTDVDGSTKLLHEMGTRPTRSSSRSTSSPTACPTDLA
jgi:hypothetical protein